LRKLVGRVNWRAGLGSRDSLATESCMELTKYVLKRSILPSLKSTTKVEVLREMSEAILTGKKKALRPVALEQILGRESLESTALGHGIAFPHGRIAELDDLLCAVGISRKGVDFRSVDSEKVHLVFMMLYPPHRHAAYMNFVAGVVRALLDEDRAEALRDAGDAAAVLEILGEGGGEAVEAENKARTTKAGVEALDTDGLAAAELQLLNRLELYGDMLVGARQGKKELQRRCEELRALVSRRVLSHYDRLKKRGGPALVTFEGGVCQGCQVRLPSQQAQRVLRDMRTVATCGHCHRFLYPI
jgi:PTS system nitrogen regulatory IIA component